MKFGNADIRLIGLDIDGTLLNSRGELTPATKRELLRVHEGGVEIALCTARRFFTASMIARQLDFPVLLAVHNGAVMRRPDGTLIYEELLPERESRLACLRGREAGGFVFAYQDRSDSPHTRIFMEASEPSHAGIAEFVRRYSETNREHVRVVDDLSTDFDGGALEVMILAPEACGDGIVEVVSRALGARGHTIKNVSGDICYCEVAHPNVSKAFPLRFLAERSGYGAENLMAFGDNYNDLDMLRYVGHPFLMGNARDDLKAMGLPLAPSNDEDGVAQVLSRIRR